MNKVGVMNKVELDRLGQYAKRIAAAQGQTNVLSKDEREDLYRLLLKWMNENGLLEGPRLGVIHRISCFINGKLGGGLKDVAGSARGN